MGWIDIRNEMRIHINGGPGAIAQGYWSIIRINRLHQKSPYWVEGTNEAVNGPEYFYDDHLIRVISYPAARFSKTEKTTSGISDIAGAFNENKDTYIFAIEYNPNFARMPIEKDIIFHINKHESVNPPLPPFSITSRFKIIDVFPDYGDNGRIEMIYCVGVKSHGES